jgi:hypothetical protein
MSPDWRKKGSGRKKISEKKDLSDYRLFIVLGVAIALALLMGGAVLLTSR